MFINRISFFLLVATASLTAYAMERTSERQEVIDQTLFAACAQGDHALVAQLLRLQANVSTRSSGGFTLLMMATSHEKVVEMLLSAGALPTETDSKFGWTALTHATVEGHTKTAELILAKAAEQKILEKLFSILDKKGRKTLSLAASNGRTEIIGLFLRYGAQVDDGDSLGSTALMFAAECNQEKAIRLLLKKGAQINKRNKLGWTALFHIAHESNNNSNNCVDLLVSKGADSNAHDNDGMTPLMLAAGRNLEILVTSLIKNKAALEARDSKGVTALQVAAAHGALKAVDVLLTAGASVDSSNADGYTALMDAASQDHPQIIARLLDAGAKIDATNNQGRTPVMIAAEHSAVRAVAMLVKRGAAVTERDNAGLTALILARGHRLMGLILNGDKEALEKASKLEAASQDPSEEQKAAFMRRATRAAASSESITNETLRNINYCASCHKQGPKKLCSRCESVRYCSRECQKAHWPEHKPNCQKKTP